MDFFDKFVRLSVNEGNPAQFPTTVWGAIKDIYRLDAWRWNLLLGASTIAAVIEPIIMAVFGMLVDDIGSGAVNRDEIFTNPLFLIMVAAFLIGFTFFDTLDIYIQNLLVNPKLAQRSRLRAMTYITQQSMEFFNNEMAGRVSAKVFDFGRSASDLMIMVITQSWYVMAFFFGTVLFAFHTHWMLATALLLWGAASTLLIVTSLPRISEASSKLTESYTTAMGRCVDIISNISLTKLFSKPDTETAGFLDLLNVHLKNSFLKNRIVSNSICRLFFSSSIFVTCIIALSLWLWAQQEIQLGALVAMVPLALRIRIQMEWIFGQASIISENYGTVKTGLETLTRPIQVLDKPDAREMPRVQGHIILSDVNFTYPSGRVVFENLNLTIPAGQKVGLVGPSGAGKTTLLQLLLRFHDVVDGAITIDGYNIANVTQVSLRRQIGMVTQEPALLNRSIRDNLLYGKPDATEDDILTATRKAAAHEFIPHLRDKDGRTGYDAHVGERGVKLSGGQRQRIAIARLILKDAPVMLLDEATSALDSEIEALVQEQIYPLMANKTAIAIAHRLSTVMQMDRLIVLDHGKIVEDGSHADLLAHGGLYAKLWARQSQGFLPKD